VELVEPDSTLGIAVGAVSRDRTQSDTLAHPKRGRPGARAHNGARPSLRHNFLFSLIYGLACDAIDRDPWAATACRSLTTLHGRKFLGSCCALSLQGAVFYCNPTDAAPRLQVR
jgi:hypothetical protein